MKERGSRIGAAATLPIRRVPAIVAPIAEGPIAKGPIAKGMTMARALGLLAALAVLALVAPVEGGKVDRHAGYYYPAPRTEEVYTARAQTLPEGDRARRIGFVTSLSLQLQSNAHPPPFAIFAKGEDAEKMIIVGLRDGELNTIYRARALFAMLTASARGSQFFVDHHVEDYFTFFDLAKLLGFTQITISDGQRFSHRVTIK